MRFRVVRPHKHSKSRFPWFRIVVPADLRDEIGKTEIRKSLETADPDRARIRHAELLAEWKERFRNLRLQKELGALDRAPELVEAFLQQMDDRRHGDLDGAIYAIQKLIVARLLTAWGPYEFKSHEADLALAYMPSDCEWEDWEDDPLRDVIPEDERATLVGRIRLLHRNPYTLGAGFRDAIRYISSARRWDAVAFEVTMISEFTGAAIPNPSALFDAVAACLVQRLVDYKSYRWDQSLLDAIEPPRSVDVPVALPQPGPRDARVSFGSSLEVTAGAAPTRPRLFPIEEGGQTLSKVFERWAAAQPPEANKLSDEWRVAVRRFVELFGDLHVAQIDSGMVRDFREAMARLPSRPRKEVVALPLLEQIKLAKAENLRTLMGPTVAKLVSGIRVTLQYACDPLEIITVNPAQGVTVTNAKSDTHARLPFSPEDLNSIFGYAAAEPAAFTDDEFWLQLLAPLTGLRIEEMGKLRPSNVRKERGIWYIAVEPDPLRQRRAAAAEGEAPKRAKTEGSYRHIPVHSLLLDAGFIELVDQAASQGRPWVFGSLEADRYGSRTKNVSRRLIRKYRDIGIVDEEKVFYSFRHSMKRACRNTTMKEEIADLLAGHAPASVGRKYGAGAALNVLHDAVNLIEYETIPWDAIIAAARARL
jgi:integrase